MNEAKSFLGTGWAFPPTFTKAHKEAVMLSDADDIENSLEILLSTSKGDRMLRPDFGCNLYALAFETLDSSAEAELAGLIRDAILEFEPRVNPGEIAVENVSPEGIAFINIQYTISATNSSQNLVFPFYLNGGGSLP